MVCRSMLASDSGEMDSALFLLSRGVNLGLEKRDTGDRQQETQMQKCHQFCLLIFEFFATNKLTSCKMDSKMQTVRK